jgi:hypothetical protein
VSGDKPVEQRQLCGVVVPGIHLRTNVQSSGTAAERDVKMKI